MQKQTIRDRLKEAIKPIVMKYLHESDSSGDMDEAINRCNKAIKTKSPSLNLSYLKIIEFPPNISELRWLQRLEIDATRISDLFPICNLRNLVRISGTSSQIADLRPISKLSKLEELIVNDTRISNVHTIAKLQKLRTLFIGETRVTDISPLSNFFYLRMLDIGDTKISDLSPLLKLKFLETLYCENIDDAILQPITDKMKDVLVLK